MERRKKRRKSRPPKKNANARTSGIINKFTSQGGPDLNYFDWPETLSNVATGGAFIWSVVQIPEGTGASERNGSRVTIKKFMSRYSIKLNTQTVSPPQGEQVRVIYYIDSATNGTGAATTDILKTASVLSFNNLEEGNRFRIIHDKTHVINPDLWSTTATVGSGHRGYMRLYTNQ